MKWRTGAGYPGVGNQACLFSLEPYRTSVIRGSALARMYALGVYIYLTANKVYYCL